MDASTGQQVLSLPGHTTWIESLAFSPDGRRLASASRAEDRSRPGEVKVWDLTTGQVVRTFKGLTDNMVCGVAFSPDGRRLASASHDNAVKVWDLATGREILSIGGHTTRFSSLAFSPDGRHLAGAGRDWRVHVWDTSTGKPTFTLEGHREPITAVAFSPDGQRLASGSEDGTGKIWDAATGRVIATFEGHANWVRSLAFSPDSERLASGAFGDVVRVWDAATGRPTLVFRGLDGDIGTIGLAFSPDGKRLAGTTGREVKVWDITPDQEALSLREHTGKVVSLAFSPDGQRLASASMLVDRQNEFVASEIKVWDVTTGKETLSVQGSPPVEVVTFGSQGNRLITQRHQGFSGEVRVWDVATGRLSQSWQRVSHAACSADGKYLAIALEDQGVIVWDLATGVEALIRRDTGSVFSMDLSPDGQHLAIASDAGTVDIVPNFSGRRTLSLQDSTGTHPSRLVRFSPDGKRLAGTSDKDMKVWDLTTGREVLSLQGNLGALFSPDGRHLVVNRDSRMEWWDTVSGKEVLVLRAHIFPAPWVLSPNGKRLAAGAGNQTVKLWELTTGEEILSLKGHVWRATAIAFSPDGRRLASANEDGTVRIWDATPVDERR